MELPLPDRPLLSPREVGRALGFQPRTVIDMCNPMRADRAFFAVRVGSRWRIHRQSVLDYWERQVKLQRLKLKADTNRRAE